MEGMLLSQTADVSATNREEDDTPVAGQTMKSLHLEEVVISGGEPLEKKVDSGGDVDVQVQHLDDVDKQRLRWEALDEERQVWDAVDKQNKLKKKEEKRQKQEDRKQKKENKKKRKLEVEAKGKELEERRKKSTKIRETVVSFGKVTIGGFTWGQYVEVKTWGSSKCGSLKKREIVVAGRTGHLRWRALGETSGFWRMAYLNAYIVMLLFSMHHHCAWLLNIYQSFWVFLYGENNCQEI